MVIGEKTVSPESPYIIGEVGLAHDGSLSLAHSYVDAIACADADAVKFQMHTPSQAEWRAEPEWPQDASRYDYWLRTAFTPDQWKGLKEHTEDRGLHFLCSPFSVEAFRRIDALGVPAWKIPSGQINNHDLLKRIAKTGKPPLLSTGMATWDEIIEAVEMLSDPVLLQCSSLYPAPPNRVGLNIMGHFRRAWTPYVGLSDHSGTIYPSLVALSQRASVIEVHVVLDRYMDGFDASSSVTPAELKQIVEGAKFISKMTPVDKNDLEPYKEARRVFM